MILVTELYFILHLEPIGYTTIHMSIRMLPLKGQGPGQGTAQDTTPPLDPNYHHNSKFSFDKLQMRMSGRKTLRRRHSSLADCDIVKKGTLHMKRPPKSLKIRLKVREPTTCHHLRFSLKSPFCESRRYLMN